MQFVEKVTQALEKGKYVVGVFLDLKKAFDTVNHSILLKKLHAIGIRGSHYQWIQSYLNFVSYKSTNSDTQKAIHGIPQGSTLGPLILYYL